jgi:hypothetical protein
MPHIQPGYSLGPDTTIYFDKDESPSPFYFDETKDPTVPPKPPAESDESMNTPDGGGGLAGNANLPPGSPEGAPTASLDYLISQNEAFSQEINDLNAQNILLTEQLNATRDQLSQTQEMFTSLQDRVARLEQNIPPVQSN